MEHGLREAIRSGRLGEGERLPSSRNLAASLGVSRGLVQECYGQLQAEGYLTSRGGSATRVAALAVPSPVATTVSGPAAPRVRLRSPSRSTSGPGVPDLASFPRGDWVWAWREVCRDVPNAGLDYGDPAGAAALREIIAGYLSRVRGAVAGPGDVVVCNGFAQALALLLRALSPGRRAPGGLRGPRLLRHRDCSPLAAPGIEAVPVPVDADGIEVDRLAASGVRAVVLTPAHQWPTGVVLAPDRRHALLKWAERTDATIIEDDYDARVPLRP